MCSAVISNVSVVGPSGVVLVYYQIYISYDRYGCNIITYLYPLFVGEIQVFCC